MTNKHPITAMIDRWPTRATLAEDIGESVHNVHKWAQSGRIPSSKQHKVVCAAQGRGYFDVTAEWLILAQSIPADGAAA